MKVKSIFGIFYFFTIEKIKMLFKQEKIIRYVWRCIDRTPVPKLVCKISIRQFWCWRCTTDSGRPVEADEDTIKALIDANRRITTREIAERLNWSNSTVHDHLKRVWLKIVFHFHKKKRNYFPNNLIIIAVFPEDWEHYRGQHYRGWDGTRVDLVTTIFLVVPSRDSFFSNPRFCQCSFNFNLCSTKTLQSFL